MALETGDSEIYTYCKEPDIARQYWVTGLDYQFSFVYIL
jgi:hypothetical protein